MRKIRGNFGDICILLHAAYTLKIANLNVLVRTWTWPKAKYRVYSRLWKNPVVIHSEIAAVIRIGCRRSRNLCNVVEDTTPLYFFCAVDVLIEIVAVGLVGVVVECNRDGSEGCRGCGFHNTGWRRFDALRFHCVAVPIRSRRRQGVQPAASYNGCWVLVRCPMRSRVHLVIEGRVARFCV